ncbi:hypothetical protein HU230_0012520 [Bradyrhizobium quebecense]|uniref:Uncharacterized protein n=1 Tax=Bradyrhizobium quebecense TaxID=2748629 RepID=A0A974ADL4_9BRAD|nr:hypothetical protein [Bradyrhizobium quebecense]UGA46813.1 hypothetical protein HU230_0012520 [Bradyrhizobium quebecense]
MSTIIALLFIVAAWLVGIAAWVTHVIFCIKTASYVFLIAGALVAPVGIIHGIGLWFGAW